MFWKNFHFWKNYGQKKPKIPFRPSGLGQTSHSGNVGGVELPTRIQVDPIEGYRTWRVRLDDEGVMGLASLMMSYEWREHNEASCRGGAMTILHDDPAPSPGCACGFYTQKPNHPLTEWDSHVRGRVRANGQAALSGRVIACSLGYKAQYASIVSPVFLDVDCRGRDCQRDVTHIQVGGSDDFWGSCPDHLPDRADVVMVDSALWMRTCVDQLKGKYPNVEFLTFMPI